MYQIEMWNDRRWIAIGGSYPTKERAHQAIEQFQRAASKKKPMRYRVKAR